MTRTNREYVDRKLEESQSIINDNLDKIETNYNTRFDRVEKMLERIYIELLEPEKARTCENENTEKKNSQGEEKTSIATDLKGESAPKSITLQPELPKVNQLTSYGPDVQWSNEKRRPDGTLNLSRLPDVEFVHSDESTTFVKNIWPEARLASELSDIGETSDRNCVSLKEWHINYADENVFNKLRHIQNTLYTGLVPYARWSQKLATELSGDFEDVAEYIRVHNPPWMEALESIFQTLQQHHVLHSPSTDFSRLSPKSGETMVTFAERMRESFYQLPRTRQTESLVRTVLLDNIRRWMPSIFRDLRFEIPQVNTRELVNLIVIAARQEAFCVKEKNRFATPIPIGSSGNKNSSIIISPRDDDGGNHQVKDITRIDTAHRFEAKPNENSINVW